jgi:hypothetical protein
VVDREACDRLAELISTWRIPVDREESPLPQIPQQLVGNFYLGLVAICHQTSPPGRPPLEGRVNGLLLRGWDYLSARFEQAVSKDTSLLSPESWAHITTRDVRELFRDKESGDRLSSPKQRAELLRDLGRQMIARDWTVADQIYTHCRGRLGIGDPNLLGTLAAFRAYRDPVSKKSILFLALMRNSKLWRYVDEQNLGAPVDYHEVRGHLRLGTVRVQDPALFEHIRVGKEVSADQDIAIRRAVYDAILYISDRSGIRNPSQLHYFFWNVFRSICTRAEPQCFALRPNHTLPERYAHIGGPQTLTRCPFSQTCQSAGIASPICEHVVETDYY